jgi:hypothetical protein
MYFNYVKHVLSLLYTIFSPFSYFGKQVNEVTLFCVYIYIYIYTHLLPPNKC